MTVVRRVLPVPPASWPPVLWSAQGAVIQSHVPVMTDPRDKRPGAGLVRAINVAPVMGQMVGTSPAMTPVVGVAAMTRYIPVTARGTA